jgi:hypothetical protein
MGSRSGRIFRYTGFEGGNVFSAYTRLDSAYSFILSENSRFTSYMSAPAIADIDADGKYEMVVGNVYGGLLLYKQIKTVSINEQEKEVEQLSLFPNPAKTEIFIDLKQTFSENSSSVSLYNTMGQLVKKVPFDNGKRFIKIDIQDLALGIYVCVVAGEKGLLRTVFVKQ